MNDYHDVACPSVKYFQLGLGIAELAGVEVGYKAK